MVTDSRNAAPPARIAMYSNSKPREKGGEVPVARPHGAGFVWLIGVHVSIILAALNRKRKFSIGPVRGDINANFVEYAPCRSQFLQTPQELVEFVGGVEVRFQLA